MAAREFGMLWIELRGMWNKNIVSLDSKEVAEAQRILKKYELRVTDIASPLFKTAWKDDPRAKEKQPADFHASFTFDQQGEVLDRAIEMAKAFQTDRIRCFDFFKLEDPAPHRDAINQILLDAANKCGKNELILVLENDGGLNTATGAEAAKVLNAVQFPYFMLNWDPGNMPQMVRSHIRTVTICCRRTASATAIAKTSQGKAKRNGHRWGKASLIGKDSFARFNVMVITSR